jgi:hypothetical protein
MARLGFREGSKEDRAERSVMRPARRVDQGKEDSRRTVNTRGLTGRALYLGPVAFFKEKPIRLRTAIQ